jgi:acetoin utilization protein AcuB
MSAAVSIKKIMSTKLVTVNLDDTLDTVKAIFDNLKFHHVLVIEERKLLGVVSDRDLLKALSPNIGSSRESYQDLASLNKRVHQIMTRRPVVLPESATVDNAIYLFNTHSISCLPVVDPNNKPVGIVSWRDIMKNLRIHPTVK